VRSSADRLAELRKNNLARMERLKAQGVVVEVTPDAYLVALLEYILGEELTEAQCLFEVKTGEALERAESQANRVRLLGQFYRPPFPAGPAISHG
jgi:hypothetical protein